jgi:hypothetical protein
MITSGEFSAIVRQSGLDSSEKSMLAPFVPMQRPDAGPLARGVSLDWRLAACFITVRRQKFKWTGNSFRGPKLARPQAFLPENLAILIVSKAAASSFRPVSCLDALAALLLLTTFSSTPLLPILYSWER